MIRVLLALLAVALIAGALGGRAQTAGRGVASPTATPAPPALTTAALDRQDRVDERHRLRESRAFDERPLLRALPHSVDGVRIDIAGLEADGRTVVLRVSSGGRSREHARTVYRRLLAIHDDAGTSYRLRWER